MGRTTCTEPQCLYKGALYLTVKLYLYYPYGPYGLYKGTLYLTFPPSMCHGPGGWSPNSHCRSPSSIPGPCEICGRQSGNGTCFFSGYFGYPLSVPLHLCSMFSLITCCSYHKGIWENLPKAMFSRKMGENWISSLKG
jgi:hypothetical protein